MWKIFLRTDNNVSFILSAIDKIKSEVFSLMEIEVKEYFAKKAVLYFDNNSIFHPKRGLHFNLMEALSTAEKDMLGSNGLFGKIELYWLREENRHTLMIFGLDDNKEFVLKNQNFNLIKRDAVLQTGSFEEMEHVTWRTLIFDMELVNYASGWIDYTPNLETRSILQTEYILSNMHTKNNPMSLLEILDFEKNIMSHPSYDELYQKVLRIMPKVETSLEQEWQTENTIIPKEVPKEKEIPKEKNLGNKKKI